MIKTILALSFMLLLWTDGQAQQQDPASTDNTVHTIPLVLSPNLEAQRAELEKALRDAQLRLQRFAIQNNWGQFVKERFAERAEIYDDKAQFDRALIGLAGLDATTKIPLTYCAALENNVLISVSPRLYREIYPEGVEERSFEKLLTHEMAHRLHIRILKGNEDAMGAVWFYEGFAVYAAGQFADSRLPAEEIWKIVKGKDERTESYRHYAAAFRFFLTKATIVELVDKAGSSDFVKYLENLPASK